MKRQGYIIEKIASLSNMWDAFLQASKARRNKNQRVIARVRNNFDEYANELADNILAGEYQTSEYTTFQLNERGKDRTIYRLPFWPDRVVHHAISQVLAPLWRRTLILDTSSSIPGRGIHFAAKRVRNWVRYDQENTQYCLQLDIRKYYPSIPHEPMIEVLGRQVKDPLAMTLMAEIVRSIDVSAPGVGLPIGNYLSQWWSNLYLSSVDHWIKSLPEISHYHRYCDDMILFSDSPEKLHAVRLELWDKLAEKQLTVKPNWRVLYVPDGLDFVGYKFFPEKTLMRKSIKKRMIVATRNPSREVIAAYNGWASFGSCYNLSQKFLVM